MEVFTMAEKVDFHVKADKAMSVKAKELSGMTNRQLYELGCKIAIEQNRNRLDAEILEINDLMDRVNELQDSILELLKDKEVPTKPDVESDPEDDDFRRNILPLDLFKEICLYYMDDFDITDINDLTNKNKEIFRFVLINLSHHKLTIADINELYAEINSE